jgi:transcriptional regulator with XRE-family HTH domain
MDKLTRSQVAELSAAIIARGITVDGLAAAAGTSVPIVQMIMQGRLNPDDHIRHSLAEALGIDPRVIE